MRKPLTIARTMPTILRLEFDDVVVVVVPERANNSDMNSRGGRVDTLSALGCENVRGCSLSSPLPDGV